MKQLSSLDMRYLAKELQLLVNSRVDNVYMPDKKEMLIQFYMQGKGKEILRIVAGKMAYLTQIKEPYDAPPQFCMFLRKHICNTRLKELKQKESERILELVFESKESRKHLIIEFFGGGNIILCDKDGAILSALEFHEWKDRKIGPKMKYVYPKKQFNLFELKHEDVKSLFKNSQKDSLVTCLAVELGIGGIYAEEVCLLSNIDKSISPQSADENTIKPVLQSIKKIIANKTKPVIYYKNGEAENISPFELSIYNKLDKKEFASYNEALEYYFVKEYRPEKKETKHDIEIKKFKGIIEQQEKKIKELEIEREESRKKAEIIYANYALIKELISSIKTTVEQSGWKDIMEKFRENNVIRDISAKEKKIIVRLE